MWKEYFDFTHQEKRGILILLVLILLISLASSFINSPSGKPQINAEKMARLQQHFIQTEVTSSLPTTSANQSTPEKEYFYFDPNTLSLEDGLKLDLSEKQIKVIQSYIAKGGKFRNASDLQKIYSLSKKDQERLIPWVAIPEDTISPVYPDQKNYVAATDSVVRISLNSCNAAELLSIRCLSMSLAERIIKFRDKLGGFYSVDQLSEVYGLQGSCLSRLKENVFFDPLQVKKISINFATRNELGAHPYIGQIDAAKIDEFRIKSGFISNADILSQNQLIDHSRLEKVLPYLIFKE